MRPATTCSLIFLAIVFLGLLLSGCATQNMTSWTMPEDVLARFKGNIPLKRNNGSVVVVSREGYKNFSDSRDAMERYSGTSARLFIIETTSPNAFATVHNGHQYIAMSISMLNEMGVDRDAVASIVGHELAHLKLGHGNVRKERESTASIASNILGTVLNVAGVPMGGTIASVGITAYSNSFTRDEEREADELGQKLAIEAGYDPCGAVRAFRYLQRSSSVDIPFLSTHPGHEERIKRANEYSLRMRNKICDIDGDKPRT